MYCNGSCPLLQYYLCSRLDMLLINSSTLFLDPYSVNPFPAC